MDILKILQKEFGLKEFQVKNTVELVDEGNTIPFIARYRKELTGSLDDQTLRSLCERLEYLRALVEKKDQIKRLIQEQTGELSEELEQTLDKAETLTELEDIYRPFRPKRRTRATIAKEKGLEDLALSIFEQKITDVHEEAKKYLNDEVETVEDAIQGAKDILAEIISDNADIRSIVRKITFDESIIYTTGEGESVYEMYYDFCEPVKKIAAHRVLAINRGEKENVLKVRLEVPTEQILMEIQNKMPKGSMQQIMTDTIEDAYKRLIQPSVEREVRNALTEKAEEGATKLFATNLTQLLLAAPLKNKVVLALDPGFRTGCKLACVDETGKVLETGVIYPIFAEGKIKEAKDILRSMLNKYNVDIIAIGNGTASGETEFFVSEFIKELDKKVYYTIVNEAGASVYSASKLGAEEFPKLDVSVRSAISIARRLQDPLAELVKIDPKSIGVGQYQHDINQKKLSESLSGVVEYCVNNVGVNLNTASPALLSHVSGLSSSVCKNILEYREENGKFKNRKELLKVKKLGKKAYEQCAGFLRIVDGDNPLDNTSVHPESYDVAKKLIDMDFKSDNVEEISRALNVGKQTLVDIIHELEKPGRDPRENIDPPILRTEVLSIKDLSEGMLIRGTVRNIIDFGAFVDIGVHQDGLVHISEMSDKFVKHPLEIVNVGDIVDVKILSVDVDKKRIALSMKR